MKFKIKIVAIYGGLGNQMFQYAFYHAMKNQAFKGDFVFYFIPNFKDHNGFELKKLFRIRKNFVLNILLGIIKKFFKKSIYNETNACKNYNNEKIIQYYNGYWVSEKHFEKYNNQIRKIYEFNVHQLNQKSIEILKKINISNSVSLHIRRGDYVQNESFKNVFEDLTSSNYYLKSIDFFLEKYENVVFFVFSNDIEFTKIMLSKYNNIFFVDWNIGINSWQDMFLMSKCKHNIIANSTFSWWSAWLNKNDSKIVISPTKWYKNNTFVSTPEDWLKIDL